MGSLISWLPWLLSGGTLVWIALAIFAPTVLTIITPILKGIAEGLVEYWKLLWNGLMDMIDNSASIVFVASVALVFYAWGWSTGHSPRVKESKQITQSVKQPTKEKEKSFFDTWRPL